MFDDDEFKEDLPEEFNIGENETFTEAFKRIEKEKLDEFYAQKQREIGENTAKTELPQKVAKIISVIAIFMIACPLGCYLDRILSGIFFIFEWIPSVIYIILAGVLVFFLGRLYFEKCSYSFDIRHIVCVSLLAFLYTIALVFSLDWGYGGFYQLRFLIVLALSIGVTLFATRKQKALARMMRWIKENIFPLFHW